MGSVLTETALLEGRVDLVLAHLYAGNPDAARAHIDAARRAAEASGSDTAQAWALVSHGEVLLDSDPPQATALLEEAIERSRRTESRLVEGIARVSL